MTRLSALAASIFAGALFAACFSPENGDYVLEPDGDVNTDCPESDTGVVFEFEEQTAEVEVNDDKDEMEFTLEDSDPLDCELDGMEFTCESDDAVYDYSSYGMAAVMTYAGGVDGEWTSNSTFDGNVWFDISCVGADCTQFGGYANCGGDADFTAELDD